MVNVSFFVVVNNMKNHHERRGTLTSNKTNKKKKTECEKERTLSVDLQRLSALGEVVDRQLL